MKLLSDSTNVWDLMYDQYGFCPDYTKESYSWNCPEE